MRRMRLGTGVLVGVLLLVLGAALVWRTSGGTRGAEAGPSARARTAQRALPAELPADRLRTAPLPASRGALRIRGRVVDARGPVAGATVVATAPEPGESLTVRPCGCDNACGMKLLQCACGEAARQMVELVLERRGEAPPLARATTDAEGAFVLEGLAEGTYALWADGPGASGVTEAVSAGMEDVLVRLDEGSPVAGRVRDEDGTAVPRALVTALHAGSGRFLDALTDAEGRFAFGALPRGPWSLVVAADGLLPAHQRLRAGSGQDAVEVGLERPRRIAGRVTRGGEPVEGAQVHLEGNHRKEAVQTDAEGRFAVEELRPDATYTLQASAGDADALAQVHLAEGGESREDVELALEAGARVTGRVVSQGGAPVAGARVSVDALAGGHEDGPTVLSGPDGRFSLGALPEGRYTVSAEAKRFRDGKAPLQVGRGGHVEVVLAPAVLVEGRVVDASGAPAEGAQVAAHSPPDAEGDSRWLASARAGEDGAFTLELEAPGALELQVDSERFERLTRAAQAPASGLVLTLSPGASITGSLLDETGAPVPSATVSARPERVEGGEGGHGAREGSRTQETGPRGTFALEGLSAGGYVVEAQALQDGVSRTVEQRLRIGSGEAHELTLRLPAGGTVSGVVVDGQGAPVEGASVLAVLAEDASGVGELDSERAALVVMRSDKNRKGAARTDAQGRFTLRHVGDGAYHLLARGERMRPPPGQPLVVARAGARDVRLVLQHEAALSGRVVREDGSPVPRFTVNGRPFEAPDGTFHLPLPPGAPVRREPLRLVFAAPGLAAEERKVELQPGAPHALGDVVLSAGRALSGRVVDGAGRPVRDALVDVGAAEDVGAPFGLSENAGAARTGADGRFRLPNVARQGLGVYVSHPDYRPLARALGASEDGLTLQLARGGRVEGRLLDRDGKPLEGYVHLTRLDAEEEQPRYGRAEGDFEVGGLAPGRYRLVGNPSDDAPHLFLPREVEVKDGTTVRVELQAARGVRVSVHTPQGEGRLQLALLPGDVPLPKSPQEAPALWTSGIPSTGQEGGVGSWQDVPAGPYTLVAVAQRDPKQRGLLHVSRQLIEVPAAGELTVELRPVWTRIDMTSVMASGH
jgi:protocatechuate 3,4-dioxygenase beta subunit